MILNFLDFLALDSLLPLSRLYNYLIPSELVRPLICLVDLHLPSNNSFPLLFNLRRLVLTMLQDKRKPFMQDPLVLLFSLKEHTYSVIFWGE